MPARAALPMPTLVLDAACGEIAAIAAFERSGFAGLDPTVAPRQRGLAA